MENNRRCDTNSINPIFYYILDIEVTSQSLSNFFVELRSAVCHNNAQVVKLKYIYSSINLFCIHGITFPKIRDESYVMSHDQINLSFDKNCCFTWRVNLSHDIV